MRRRNQKFHHHVFDYSAVSTLNHHLTNLLSCNLNVTRLHHSHAKAHMTIHKVTHGHINKQEKYTLENTEQSRNVHNYHEIYLSMLFIMQSKALDGCYPHYMMHDVCHVLVYYGFMFRFYFCAHSENVTTAYMNAYNSVEKRWFKMHCTGSFNFIWIVKWRSRFVIGRDYSAFFDFQKASNMHIHFYQILLFTELSWPWNVHIKKFVVPTVKFSNFTNIDCVPIWLLWVFKSAQHSICIDKTHLTLSTFE